MKRKTKNPVIFINEDDVAFCKLIEKTLSASGFNKIKVFHTGEECIHSLQNIKPDIVIQDFAMPGLNGIEIMQKIKSIYPETEFIFLSGQSSIKVAVEIIKQGAFDYIIKDEVAMQNVIQKISKILYIQKLKHEKKMSIYGRRLFLTLLIGTWLIIALLWYLGILKEITL
jgi:DNA-binding NtrC family response regulator